MTTAEIALGSTVTYVDGKGHKKLAFVTGTPATIESGTNLPVPTEGELHLIVFAPAGNVYARLSVPSADIALARLSAGVAASANAPVTAADFAVDPEDDETEDEGADDIAAAHVNAHKGPDGQLVRYWMAV
jgi:hypothetical protein